MNSTKETLSPTRVRLTVELTPEEVQPAVDKAFKKIAEQVNIPGFRKGKVPARIIEQRFGRAMVIEEALNEAVPAALQQALAENEVAALGTPNVTIDQDLTELGEGDAVTFVAEVDVRPDVELPEYKGLAVEVEAAVVADEDVQEALDELRTRFASVTPVERAAADGDLVVVDVEGSIDGEKYEEFSGSAMTFEVGADNMIEGFDDAVRGKSADESATFAYTAEEGEFAGREAELTVTIKGVRERDLPEADDDFALMASEFDTIDELRDDLRSRLERVKLIDQGIEARDKLAAQLLEVTDIPVPDGFLEQTIAEHFADGHGDDEHRAEFEQQTRDSLRNQFLLDAIAEAESITVEQDDLTGWIVQQAPRYQMTPDQFIQALVQADQLGNAYGDVRRGKALTAVLEAAEITDVNGAKVDLTALDVADDGDLVEVDGEETVEVFEDADGNTVIVDEVVEVLEDADGNTVVVDDVVEVIEDADGNIVEVDEVVEVVEVDAEDDPKA